jgi:hypothetical protein
MISPVGDNFSYRIPERFIHEEDTRVSYTYHIESKYPSLAKYILNYDIDGQRLPNSYMIVRYKEGKDDEYEDDYKVFQLLLDIKNYYFMYMCLNKYKIFDIAIKRSDDGKKIEDKLLYDMCDQSTMFTIRNAIDGFYYHYGIDLLLIPQTQNILDTGDFNGIFKYTNLLDLGIYKMPIDTTISENPYMRNILRDLKINDSIFVSDVLEDIGHFKTHTEAYDERQIRILGEINYAKDNYDLVIVPYLGVHPYGLVNGVLENTHANYMIYSRYDNCVMRYDPHGDIKKDFIVNEMFETIFPNVEVYSNFTRGLQRYDKEGFCI